MFLAGQAVPGLNTDKPHRLGLGRPDQHIRVARNVAANRTAGIFFNNGQGLAAQVDHAEAIVGKQVVGQRDGADVAAKIIEIRAVEQAVRQRADAQRAFQRVEPEFIIGRGVGVVKRHREGRVIPDAEPQFLCIAGVAHGQGVAHGPAGEAEGRAQHKGIRPEGAGFFIVAQLKGQAFGVLGDQGVFDIAGKAMLAAGIFGALGAQLAAGQFAGIGEENRRVPAPDRGIAAPEHFGPGLFVDNADSLGPVGVHGQAQRLVFNRIAHDWPPGWMFFAGGCRPGAGAAPAPYGLISVYPIHPQKERTFLHGAAKRHPAEKK